MSKCRWCPHSFHGDLDCLLIQENNKVCKCLASTRGGRKRQKARQAEIKRHHKEIAARSALRAAQAAAGEAT